jgi:hypothetical protein
MLAEAAMLEEGDDERKYLERHPDFYSLRPHLSPQVFSGPRARTLIAGSTIPTLISDLVDEVGTNRKRVGFKLISVCR